MNFEEIASEVCDNCPENEDCPFKLNPIWLTTECANAIVTTAAKAKEQEVNDYWHTQIKGNACESCCEEILTN